MKYEGAFFLMRVRGILQNTQVERGIISKQLSRDRLKVAKLGCGTTDSNLSSLGWTKSKPECIEPRSYSLTSELCISSFPW